MVNIVVVELAPVKVESLIVAKAFRALIAHELVRTLENLVLYLLRLGRLGALYLFLWFSFHHL